MNPISFCSTRLFVMHHFCALGPETILFSYNRLVPFTRLLFINQTPFLIDQGCPHSQPIKIVLKRRSQQPIE